MTLSILITTSIATASAANANVTLGCPNKSFTTIYCNDASYSSDNIYLPVSNYNKSYKYYAIPSNSNIISVSGKVNNNFLSSKIYAKRAGTATIKYYATNNNGKQVSNIQIVTIHVLERGFSTPKITRAVKSSTTCSISWSVNSNTYINSYKVEYSVDNFKTYTVKNVSSNTKNYKLTGLRKGQTYYIRVVSISNLCNTNAYLYHRSAVTKIKTNLW